MKLWFTLSRGMLVILLATLFISNMPQRTKIARVKYNGGGDWYSSKTALKNLIRFSNQQNSTHIHPEEATVSLQSEDLFLYPFLFLTGHGNIVLNETEVSNLRNYLLGGGFLHLCDNYGMDPYIRREMKKVFPELDFVVVPFSHPIYQQPFSFKNGLPKVHEHNGKNPIGYGIFWKNRLVCFYDYECDLGNGWEDQETYNDEPAVREKALQMGSNLIHYAFTQ